MLFLPVASLKKSGMQNRNIIPKIKTAGISCCFFLAHSKEAIITVFFLNYHGSIINICPTIVGIIFIQLK